jgi:hypothetical protein
LSNYSVSNIRELEPVVESEVTPQPDIGEKQPLSTESQAPPPDDPAQMKLDL